MSEETTYFTKESLEKLKAELKHLKTKGRREIAQKIDEARQKGDLSENAEYDAAKDEQDKLESKIKELEKTLANAKVLNKENIDTSKVRALTTVKLKNLDNDQEMEYKLVANSEANVREGKISLQSPIAKGLIGKEPGEVAEIEVPTGKVRFKILDISI
jgi:transcription elongation factor GreA